MAWQDADRVFHMPILGEFECAEGIVENAEEQQLTRRNVGVWLSVAEMKAAQEASTHNWTGTCAVRYWLWW